MQYIRKSADRGYVDIGWLKSKHSFSFGDYFDPDHLGISALRVINDDEILPNRGFSTHGHKDMEIITYVMQGQVEHQDSMGNHFLINPGEIQRMSAGSGILHSEFNPSGDETLTLLQIWIKPKVLDIAPSYEQKLIQQNGILTPLVSEYGDQDSITINQDATIYRLKLSESESFDLQTESRIGYLHLVKGSLLSHHMRFEAGDAFMVNPGEVWTIDALENIEALWFDLPRSK